MVFLTPELKVFNHWDGFPPCFGSLLLTPRSYLCPVAPEIPLNLTF